MSQTASKVEEFEKISRCLTYDPTNLIKLLPVIDQLMTERKKVAQLIRSGTTTTNGTQDAHYDLINFLNEKIKNLLSL